METRVKTLRTETRDLVKEYNKTEDDLKALQVGFVLKYSSSWVQSEQREPPRVGRCPVLVHMLRMIVVVSERL